MHLTFLKITNFTFQQKDEKTPIEVFRLYLIDQFC
jgi:hypothetical protein